ncbi:hypothetical protein [Agrobacterium sp. RAC06]|uniref:hypothetical protein n=1 Tax=Agrobacterium sp. RAC06 TaxID=1842536 RepID=UPI00123786DC|nr:hypothetical protein [Agrobacterium sp. RAC06]
MWKIFSKRELSFWLLLLFVFGKIYDIFISPVVSVNIETWAVSKGIDDELVDGGQNVLPYLASGLEWINWVISGLSSQIFLGFVIGALIFGFWDFLARQLAKWGRGEETLAGDSREDQTQVVDKQKRPADLKLIALIDEIYPLAHDLSEVYVDAMGNRSGAWREYFLSGQAVDYFRMMHEETQNVAQAYEPIRKLMQRYKFYDKIFLYEDAIASKINAPGTALAPAREKAERLSYRFDELSVALVEPDIEACRKAIGQLRQLVGREFLGLLETIRRNEMSRTI